MLSDIQDDIAPLFTESIHNETSSNKVKYEIIVILYNLLCINTDIRVREKKHMKKVYEFNINLLYL